ncbi:Protein phosphatase 2C family protein [Striga hermonthica]|uniref:Protein phosphatase 2C family protein n=1 Tax=Striga hermonthica TaxID=68872 RepID=A0A9N7NG20_STRHE|nr:Protein phosphatase 2C family protein [Striga hermonthica]
MMEYEEGGALAVFSSPECSQWGFSPKSFENSTQNCDYATHQGRREYQEDRVTCNLDMKLPFSAEGSPGEITVGIAAIFDGHGGQEASEMASKKLADYFFLHVVFTAHNWTLSSNNESSRRSPVIGHHSLCSILEKSLLRTIKDIDLEFSKEALDKRYISGSTATIVLLVNGKFLVANIGDSKALLCSRKNPSTHDTEGSSPGEIYTEELTRDHHPDREDEKARIEAFGGFVTKSSIPRVNGVLAVSRAIGDVYLKRYGVTAEPELTGWRPFTPENSFLIVTSDGVFETLAPENVCEIVHAIFESSSEDITKSSLAEHIIRSAFRSGSTDNLSAIVISDMLHTCKEKRCN